MKGKIIIGSFIALAISAIVVWAQPNRECPDGKIEVTIVNPAGKVIEICVPEHVVDNIGGGNDIVIPATCPCFSQGEVEAAFNTTTIECVRYEGTTTTSGEPCTYVECYEPDALSYDFLAVEGPVHSKETGLCRFETPPGRVFL